MPGCIQHPPERKRTVPATSATDWVWGKGRSYLRQGPLAPNREMTLSGTSAGAALLPPQVRLHGEVGVNHLKMKRTMKDRKSGVGNESKSITISYIFISIRYSTLFIDNPFASSTASASVTYTYIPRWFAKSKEGTVYLSRRICIFTLYYYYLIPTVCTCVLPSVFVHVSIAWLMVQGYSGYRYPDPVVGLQRGDVCSNRSILVVATGLPNLRIRQRRERGYRLQLY